MVSIKPVNVVQLLETEADDEDNNYIVEEETETRREATVIGEYILYTNEHGHDEAVTKNETFPTNFEFTVGKKTFFLKFGKIKVLRIVKNIDTFRKFHIDTPELDVSVTVDKLAGSGTAPLSIFGTDTLEYEEIKHPETSEVVGYTGKIKQNPFFPGFEIAQAKKKEIISWSSTTKPEIGKPWDCTFTLEQQKGITNKTPGPLLSEGQHSKYVKVGILGYTLQDTMKISIKVGSYGKHVPGQWVLVYHDGDNDNKR